MWIKFDRAISTVKANVCNIFEVVLYLISKLPTENNWFCIINWIYEKRSVKIICAHKNIYDDTYKLYKI